MLDQKFLGSIIAFRNDRMGARLMTMMNAIRIAEDYDLPYHFVWKTDGRTSEELLNPTQIFDAEYFADHEAPIEVYREVMHDGLDLQLLPKDSTASDLRNKADEGLPLICAGSSLIVLPWENAEDVAPRYAASIESLKFSDEVKAAMRAVDETLADKGTAFHIRRGDIIYDPITSNQLWSNKYIPREFYEVLAKRLVDEPNAKVLVFSDEPEEIERLRKLGPQILGASDVIPETLTVAQRDFIELYAMSRCGAIYGPPGSGFSMTAALMGNIEVADVRSALSEEEQAEALDILVDRLANEPEQFLSDGDIGQSLPFAMNHLNASNRSKEGLDLLENYRARNFAKIYFFQLLARQNIIEGRYQEAGEVLGAKASADLDPAIPGRLEGHWAELSRLAAIAASHKGDKKEAQRNITLAVWYSAMHRPSVITLSQMCAGGTIDPGDFALPFDPDVRRPVPQQTYETIVAREGHAALVPPGHDSEQWVMPGDLIAHDWHPFLGKSLGRGFSQADFIQRSADTFNEQFSRWCTSEAVASALGLYAHAIGDTEKALDLYETALVEQPENPLWLKRAGVTRLASDQADPIGAEMLEQAAEIGGEHSLYAAQFADFLWSAGDKDRACEMMQKLCEAELPIPELPFLTARMMRHLGRSGEDALKFIEQSLALAPHVRRFLSLRTHLLIDMGEKALAADALNVIIDRFGEAGDVKALRTRLEV